MTLTTKLESKFLAPLLAVVMVSVSTSGQTPTPMASSTAPAAPSAGLVNDWLRQQNPVFDNFDLGGQFRPRYVYQTYFAVPGAGPTAVDFRANTPESENDF